MAASVLRNLSWKADLQSKKTLRAVGAATKLMGAAMKVKKEATLKSILSALWNLSAHGSENKAEICAVGGALEFLVSTLTYKSPSKTTAVIENGGGVLRNISSHITVREDYRQILRKHGCLQILLKQLRSPSLNIVSNACGTLWNLSARCAEDQKALLDMGAVGMLRNLVNSKHQMISMGSSAALKNLLTACNIKTMGMDKKNYSNRPSLHVRKQKALTEEIDQSLSETCENVESPRDSPTENGRSDKEQTRFHFPANPSTAHNDGEIQKPQNRGNSFPKSVSGENTPVSDSHLMSSQRVARSGSQDSVGSTHSDISHDRTRFHMAMKKAKSMTDRKGGSLDRQQGNMIPRVHSDGSCEETQQASSRIIQVMKEVARHAGIDSDSGSKGSSQSQNSTPRKSEPPYPYSQSLLVRSYTGPSSSSIQYGGQFRKLPYSNSMDSDQPIDYSLNKANKPPIPPKFDNYVGQTYEPHLSAVGMHHSYSGPQKTAQNLFSISPIVQHSNMYAETDLDCEQPTDYSRRFAESHDDSDGDQPYDMRYEDNCADCKLDIARRTNERLEFLPGYNDDQVKTFCTEGTPRNYLSTANSLTDLSKGEKEDARKEHTDEEEEEEEEEDYQYEEESGSLEKGSGSQSTNQNTGTTVIASYHVATKNLQQVASNKSPNQDENISRSFHAPNENDNSPDQVKTYCDEGTPICFSRVSSLSSLHSSEAQDRQVESNRSTLRNTRGLHSIDENDSAKTPPRDVKIVSSIMAPPKCTLNSGRQKLVSESDSQGPDCAEKEHKTVTFNDDHQVQETPLMFSRCSSLGSLSSFDAHSVHSSVISDYSRRASEVVSPSELPDSPSETMPPSPSKSPDLELQHRANNPQKFDSFIDGTPKTVLFRPVASKLSSEHVKMPNIEMASTISRDEAPVVYADEGTPPHMSETNSVLSTLTIDDASKTKTTDTIQSEKPATSSSRKSVEEVDDKDNSHSEVSLDEEDILKECIRTAMPRKPRRSSSDNTLKKKSVNNTDNQKNKMSQSIEGMKQAPKPKLGSSHHSSVNEMMTKNSGDIALQSQSQIHVGVANQFSKSMSNDKSVVESCADSVKAFAEEDVPFCEKMKRSVKPEPQVKGSYQVNTMDDNLDSVTSYASEDQPAVKPNQTPKHYKKVQEILNGNLDVLESHDDCVKLYADEGTPCPGSAAMSLQHNQSKPHILQNAVRFNPALLSQVDYLFDDEEAPKSYAMEDTPYNLSEPTSPKNTVKKVPPPIPQKPVRPTNVPEFNPSLLSRVQQDVPDDDAPTSYAVEDTPYNMSKPSSPTPKVRISSPPSTESDHPLCLVNPELKIHVEDPSTYCEDTVKTYATEDTPISYSYATSLSDLSIITGISEPIKEEEQETEKPDPQENAKVEEADGEGEVEEKDKDESADLNDTKSESSCSDGSEDLLSDLIQSAMPKGRTSPKARVSRKLDMDRAAEGAESKFQPQRTSSVVTVPTPAQYASQNGQIKTSSDLDISNDLPSRIESVNTNEVRSAETQRNHSVTAGDDSVFYHTNDSMDSVKVYNLEGTPTTFSRNDSLSSLSITGNDSDVKQSGKSEGSDSAKKMPPPTHILKPDKCNSEIVLQREVEGQSSDEVSSACVQHDNKDNSDDDDDDDDDPNDEALLEACMNLALPKSKSSTFAEKQKSSSSKPLKSNPAMTGSKSFNSSLLSSEKSRKSVSTKKTTENHKHRINKSSSAVEGYMNLSTGSVTSHHSRTAEWQAQQNLNMSDDFIFAKPSSNYRRVRPHQGSWRRSRSQDSDGFLKQQKENTNMELAQSMGSSRIHNRGSAQSIPSYVDVYVDNRFIEDHHAYNHHKVHHENQHGLQRYSGQNEHSRARHNTNMEQHKRSHSESREKSGREQHNQAMYESQIKRRHHSEHDNPEKFLAIDVHQAPASQNEVDSLNRSIYQMELNNEAITFGTGIDNLGFGIGGSQDYMNEEDKLDSADVTLRATSGNNTMTNDSINQNDSVIHYDKETLSPEDEHALHLDASAVVTEIQSKRMMGSGVDEDMFIEHETLSLVSGGYMSDTPSDASITWSAHSENYSEFTMEDVASNGPRVVKPSNRGTLTSDDSKAIRGKRKPLYSRSNSSSSQKSDASTRMMKPTTANVRLSQGGRGGSVIAGATRRAPQTKTHPQASSTPTKTSPLKSKIQKPSPTQGKTGARVPNTKESPSRLPLASNRKNTADRPKPPIKQGTFTKEASTVKVPIIDDTLNESCQPASREAVKNKTNKQVNASGLDSSQGSGSWKKALGSYNFAIDNSADEKKENLTPNKRPGSVTNLNTKKSGSGGNLSATKAKPGNSPASKSTVKTTSRVNSTSNLKKTFSGTSLTKSGSGASLNKAGSGSTLNKSGSGQLLNKSGSAIHKLTGSDRVLNRGGSNPNLGRLNSSKPDLKKSDSNASLRNNSRPSTPVGRRTSAGSVQGRKSDGNTSKSGTPTEKKVGVASGTKKQVGSKIAGLWKKDDSNEITPRSSASKLPVSTTPSRQRNMSTPGSKKSSNVSLQSLNKSMNSAEILNEGISRSSTYDKINSTMDSSQLPSLDNESVTENVTIELSKSSVVLGDEIKGDYVELRILQGSESDCDMNKSIVIRSPDKNKTDSDSVTSPSAVSVKSQSSDEFDLKSLEKRIDSSTWKKKKSDLGSANLPNADDTSKSLEAVKALLDASLASESSNMTLSSSFYNTSNIQGSYLSQGSRTVNGAAWHRYKQESFASVVHSEDEGDSIWVRRDPESSKSEPELNKHSLNSKKDRKEKADNRSFLPIKAMKSMFGSSKKDKTSKSGSKLSLSSSKESLQSNKINMNEIVKVVEKEREKDKEREKKEKAKQREKLKESIALEKAKAKEMAKLEKEKSKNDKEKAKLEKEKAKAEKEKIRNSKKSDSRKSSVADESSVSQDIDKNKKSQDVFGSVNHKASPPQAALVQPFNYTPMKLSENSATETADQSFSKQQNPTTSSVVSSTPTGTNTPMTKTEMLLARRRMNSLNKTEGEESREEDINKKTGCMVTTV